MPEKEKPVQPKGGPKTVPESAIISLRESTTKEIRRLKEELATTRTELSKSTSELKIAKVNMEDDEEVKKVRDYLLDREEELNKRKATLEEDLTSFTERERGVRAKELATKYGVDVESISGEEDPEKKALELYAERLAQEKQALVEKQVSAESVFESGPGGTIKVQPKDMSDADFDKHVKKLHDEALSKK